MMRNLQSYPTTVFKKECDILWGQNILWPLLHIFRGSGPPNPQDLRSCLHTCQYRIWKKYSYTLTHTFFKWLFLRMIRIMIPILDTDWSRQLCRVVPTLTECLCNWSLGACTADVSFVQQLITSHYHPKHRMRILVDIWTLRRLAHTCTYALSFRYCLKRLSHCIPRGRI